MKSEGIKKDEENEEKESVVFGSKKHAFKKKHGKAKEKALEKMKNC